MYVAWICYVIYCAKSVSIQLLRYRDLQFFYSGYFLPDRSEREKMSKTIKIGPNENNVFCKYTLY